MNKFEIDRILNGTPCVCGNLEEGGWHPKCYEGKTQDEINAAYKKVYKKARRHIRRLAAMSSDAILAAAQGAGK